jgi:hypothetical protein
MLWMLKEKERQKLGVRLSGIGISSNFIVFQNHHQKYFYGSLDLKYLYKNLDAYSMHRRNEGETVVKP